MRIDVSGKHMEVTQAIEEHAESKTSKLSRYYDGVQQVRVVMEKAPHDSFAVEVCVDVEHHDTFVARENGEDLYKCIDGATDKMARQLRDFKEKLKNSKREPGPR